MAIPNGSTRISFVGTAPGGEIWDTSLWWTGLPIASAADANTFADAITQMWVPGDYGGISSLWASDTHLTEIRLYHYAAGGSSATYIGVSVFPTAIAGVGSTQHPLQVACCVTLQTALAGRSHRGRMYWPANGVAVTAHQMNEATTEGVSETMATLLGDLSDTLAAGYAIVMSNALSASTQLTAVRADSRLDVQRRRANRSAALYSTTTSL